MVKKRGNPILSLLPNDGFLFMKKQNKAQPNLIGVSPRNVKMIDVLGCFNITTARQLLKILNNYSVLKTFGSNDCRAVDMTEAEILGEDEWET